MRRIPKALRPNLLSMTHKDHESVITPRQLQCLAILMRDKQLHSYSPSVREMAQELGVTQTAARGLILTLRWKGLVTWEDGLCRSLRPTVKFIPADKLGA